MAQRVSGFERAKADLYETPLHPVDALDRVFPVKGAVIWEPACGNGKMVDSLKALGAKRVIGTDKYRYPGAKIRDFLDGGDPPKGTEWIVTNPPYGYRGALAVAFIERGIAYSWDYDLPVLFLLAADFDFAKSRRPLFAECKAFGGKIALHRRIKWFDKPRIDGEKVSGPSQYHAWYFWGCRADLDQGPNCLYS